MSIKIALSNHHVHLTREALDVLYGKNYELTVKRPLVQKGQFAAEETVTLVKNNKVLEHIRIVGPLRSYTQVELLDKDNDFFGIKAPVRKSGDLKGSETIDIIGPNGTYHAIESTIVADTHIHMSADDLKIFNRVNDETVSVVVNNKIINDVHIKSDETCVLEMHMNKDIAEELNIESGMEVTIC